MALVTHQLQGSYVTFSSRPSSWTIGVKLKPYIPTLHMVRRVDRCILSSHNISLSVGLPCICQSNFELSKISAFKGNAKNDKSGNRANGSKVLKNSIKLKDGDDSLTEMPKANGVPLSYSSSEADHGIAPSPAINKLFKKWLTLLRTQPPSQVAEDGILENVPSREISETQGRSGEEERSGILKMVWLHISGLDTVVKIPLLIFIPLYVAVNALYGSEVSKELTPLWIFGPLITALYIKTFQWICSLYIFTIKQSAQLIKNLPSYCKIAYTYLVSGKLKEEIHARLLQPFVDIKNLDYKELVRLKLKELEKEIVEKYLDYVESIWPFYCRTIRFLKRANLI